MRFDRVVAAVLLSSAGAVSAASPGLQFLPTGQALTPMAAPGAVFTPLITRTGPHPLYVADGASAIAVSPDKREMLVLTSGFNLFNGPSGQVDHQQSTQFIFRYAIN